MCNIVVIDSRAVFVLSAFALTIIAEGFLLFLFFKRRLLDGGTDALRDVLQRTRKIDFETVRGPLVGRCVHARAYRPPYTVTMLPAVQSVCEEVHRYRASPAESTAAAAAATDANTTNDNTRIFF